MPFNPDLAGAKAPEPLPEYREAKGHRPGNLLVVHAILPRPLAEDLGTLIEQDPLLAREVAERLVLEGGGLDRASWGQGQPLFNHRTKPPYEQLSATHRIHRITPRADGTVTAQPLKWRTGQTTTDPTRGTIVKFTQHTGSLPAPNIQLGGNGARPPITVSRERHSIGRGE
ncbi:hypothetical protein ABZX12_41295 [Kribbella sp. NPDC003505]|uniref:hypothetical protein n=1 Tax=Kribbella sp. NPDC003505 TaxID=3154448 RepID=UPI00339FB900